MECLEEAHRGVLCGGGVSRGWLVVTVSHHLPAGELRLAQAQFDAVPPRGHALAGLGPLREPVALDAIDAPGLRAGPHSKAGFLRVNGEDGILGAGK